MSSGMRCEYDLTDTDKLSVNKIIAEIFFKIYLFTYLV